jgi:hypothetical protein
LVAASISCGSLLNAATRSSMVRSTPPKPFIFNQHFNAVQLHAQTPRSILQPRTQFRSSPINTSGHIHISRSTNVK